MAVRESNGEPRSSWWPVRPQGEKLLLGALFEGAGDAAEVGEGFAGQVERAADEDFAGALASGFDCINRRVGDLAWDFGRDRFDDAGDLGGRDDAFAAELREDDGDERNVGVAETARTLRNRFCRGRGGEALGGPLEIGAERLFLPRGRDLDRRAESSVGQERIRDAITRKTGDDIADERGLAGRAGGNGVARIVTGGVEVSALGRDRFHFAVNHHEIVVDVGGLAGGGRIFGVIVADERVALDVHGEFGVAGGFTGFAFGFPVAGEKLERGKSILSRGCEGCEEEAKADEMTEVLEVRHTVQV